jgi:hypothetical protein
MSPKIARALLMVAVAAACTAPGSEQWQKAGADGPTTARDNAECREAAQDEALRRYPYRASSPALGAPVIALGQQRDDNNRAIAEASLFNTCMQGRGYKR